MYRYLVLVRKYEKVFVFPRSLPPHYSLSTLRCPSPSLPIEVGSALSATEQLSSPPQASPPPPFAGVVGPSIAASMDIERLRLHSKFQVRQGTFRSAAIFEVASVEQAKQVGRGNASAVLFAPPFAHAVVDYTLISNIRRTIGSVPLMLKVRAGHFAEAKEIQKFGMVDFLDENEVLGVVDETFIDKSAFSISFVCGCESLAEGLRRVEEVAQILRM